MNYLIPPQPIDDNNPNSVAWTDWYTKVRYAMNQSGLNWSSVTNVPANLVGLATPSTNGIYVRTGSGTAATRSIATASSSRITVSNGDGVAGNPTLDLATVTPGAGGSFLKFSVDSYGRISDTAAVTTSDLTGVLSTLTVNNSGTGDASGMTFNGSAAKTISYNTIGALPTTGGTISGNLTINGSTTLGDAAADTITVSGSTLKNGTGNWTLPAASSGDTLNISGSRALSISEDSRIGSYLYDTFTADTKTLGQYALGWSTLSSINASDTSMFLSGYGGIGFYASGKLQAYIKDGLTTFNTKLNVLSGTGSYCDWISSVASASFMSFSNGTTRGYIGTDGGAIIGTGTGTKFGIRAENDLLLMGGAALRVTIGSGGVNIVSLTGGATTLTVNGKYLINADTDGSNFHEYQTANTTVGYIGTRSGLIGSGSGFGIRAESSIDGFVSSGATVAITWKSGGAVEFPNVGTTASAANAHLASGSNNNLLRSTSSARYKTNIRDVGVTKINQLRPIRYNSLAASDDKTIDWYGLIAEEVAEVEPSLVHYVNGKPDGVQYDRITVLLLKELQDLRKEMSRTTGRL